jgi:hypothetical protein
VFIVDVSNKMTVRANRNSRRGRPAQFAISVLCLTLIAALTLGCAPSQKQEATKPVTTKASTNAPTQTTHTQQQNLVAPVSQTYPAAGTPKFWGSRICELVSRDQVDALFETQATEPPARLVNAAYEGESHENWSRSTCSWDFGLINVLEGDWKDQKYLPSLTYFRGATDLAHEPRPDDATGPCAEQPGVATNGWCDRLHIVSINGNDENLFDSFDNVFPDPPDGNPDPKLAYIAVVHKTQTVEIAIIDRAYRDPKKIAEFVELITKRLSELTPSIPASTSPSITPLSELTETQFCALLPGPSTEKMLNGKSKSIKITITPENQLSQTPGLLECSYRGDTNLQDVEATLKIDAANEYWAEPASVFEIRGRTAVIEFRDKQFAIGGIFLPNNQLLTLRFSRFDQSETTRTWIVDALTSAVTELENMGTLPRAELGVEPASPTLKSVVQEILPPPNTLEFPGESICDLLTDKDFAVAFPKTVKMREPHHKIYSGSVTKVGATSKCVVRFDTDDSWLTIAWAVSPNVVSGTMFTDPSCVLAAGCYRNRAAISTPNGESSEPNTDVPEVGFTAVLPDGRYVEVFAKEAEVSNIRELTKLGETLVTRLTNQKVINKSDVAVTYRNIVPESQLCALLSDATKQYWLGGPADEVTVSREQQSQTARTSSENEYLNGSLVCASRRNDTTIRIELMVTSLGTTLPFAMFKAGKHTVVLNGGTEMSGVIDFGERSPRLRVSVKRDETSMDDTKAQRQALKTLMTEIAGRLP